MRRSMAVAATALVWTWPTGMAAQPASRASPDVTRPFEVRWSLKGTGVFTRPSQEGLWRWRIEPTVPVGARATIEFAYEHRLAVFDEGGRSPAGLPVLSPDRAPAYRLTPLDWQIAGGERASWRHEIDRALVRLPVGRLRLDAGRQAIGWGRGVVFGAVDLFAPFSPFEVDREWRRGVDGLRADVQFRPRQRLVALDASDF